MKIHNPYSGTESIRPLRGNFHTHSTRSDGMCPQQQVLDDYAARGYDFLMLSDHDIYTTAEELAALDSKGMVLIPGNEVSRNGPHMLHIGTGGFVEPVVQRQTVITDIVQRGGLVIVNHPNWQNEFNHCSIERMREWVGYIGMEIYNGVIQRLAGSAYATGKWDMLLTDGRRIWGMANDDSHHPAKDVALGWNMVYARERTPQAVIEAVRDGQFYASTGVEISRIEVNGTKIRIETKNAQRINALMQYGTRFAFADDSQLEVEVPASAKYVRFECWGAGETFAWTQPFFVEVDAAETRAKNFLRNWYLSDLVPGCTMRETRCVSPREAGLRWTEVETGGPRLPEGLVDTRAQSSGRAGVVYCWTKFESAADGPAQLYLGFDGPVRVWVNGQQVFDGPGTNPATPDKLALNIEARRGSNELLVALNTNQGKAWAIFARVEFQENA